MTNKLNPQECDTMNPIDIHSKKKAIRKEIINKRNSMSIQERARGDLLITDRIIGHQWFYRARVLLAFLNYGSEVRTDEIIEEALRKGKTVFVPRIAGEDMLFYRLESFDDLQEGYKGIREPSGTTECFDYETYKNSQMLLLMPGVAFDLYGNRLGYGKGFYDRFLADKELLRTYSIGIGYACQQVEDLPVDEHDIKPYQVLLM